MSNRHKSQRTNADVWADADAGEDEDEDEDLFTIILIVMGLSTFVTVAGVMAASII